MKGDVVDIFTNNIDMSDTEASEDLLGRTYEYCIAQFAEKRRCRRWRILFTVFLEDVQLLLGTGSMNSEHEVHLKELTNRS